MAGTAIRERQRQRGFRNEVIEVVAPVRLANAAGRQRAEICRRVRALRNLHGERTIEDGDRRVLAHVEEHVAASAISTLVRAQ
jgi:hypothetical protein